VAVRALALALLLALAGCESVAADTSHRWCFTAVHDDGAKHSSCDFDYRGCVWQRDVAQIQMVTNYVGDECTGARFAGDCEKAVATLRRNVEIAGQKHPVRLKDWRLTACQKRH
jgi:hypothetical protein